LSPTALAIVTLLLVGVILYLLQDHYRTSHVTQRRLVICGDAEFLDRNAGILAGCRTIPCVEVLPSGEMSVVYFAYC